LAAAGRGALVVICCAAFAAPAAAQILGRARDTDVPAWRVLGALVLCLALAVGAAFALRARLRAGAYVPKGFGGGAQLLEVFRRGGLTAAKGPRRLQLVESVRLNPQVEVCLLRFDGKELLVAATPQGESMLTEAQAATTSAEPS
jgi:flagellar biogenesis protein FliO